MDMDVRVEYSGPLFIPGWPEAVMGRTVNRIETHVADLGADRLRSNLDKVLKHQTGFYRSHIKAEGDTIHDSGVIYGPWLEGTGSRNAPETSFEGYHTFRRTAQELERESARMISGIINDAVRSLS